MDIVIWEFYCIYVGTGNGIAFSTYGNYDVTTAALAIAVGKLLLSFC